MSVPEDYEDDDCSICRQDFDDAAAEHAWMGDAVKRMDFNPYAPVSQDERAAMLRLK